MFYSFIVLYKLSGYYYYYNVNDVTLSYPPYPVNYPDSALLCLNFTLLMAVTLIAVFTNKWCLHC